MLRKLAERKDSKQYVRLLPKAWNINHERRRRGSGHGKVLLEEKEQSTENG
jgi:hypothetical protein